MDQCNQDGTFITFSFHIFTWSNMQKMHIGAVCQVDIASQIKLHFWPVRSSPLKTFLIKCFFFN